MPVPVDKCASCRLPVFAEDAVPGGCGCPERPLRLLLAQRRRANEAIGFTAPNVREPLPELTPDLLMSPEGRREFHAAQTPIRGMTADLVVLDDMSFWPEAPTGQTRTASAQPQVNLEEMWMQGSGIPYEPGALTVPDHLSDFEFSTDAEEFARDINPGPTRAARSVGGQRFQVGREPPPRMPPVRRGVEPGPQGGPMREIARVGRFAVLGERLERQNLRDSRELPIYQPREAPPAPPTPTSRNALAQAKAMQAREKMPTAYDRIQSDLFDD